MFSFITRWFKKSDKEEDEEKKNDFIIPKKKVYHRGDPIPYSKKFAGAEKIVVRINDCERDNIEEVEKHIFDVKEINMIIDLLDEFPTEGERKMDTNRCLEHTIIAFKDELPFAEIKFYDGNIMLPDNMFISNSERLVFAQTQLYDLIKIV